MAKQTAAALDDCFHALAHPIRRGMLERLADGPATVGVLGAPYEVAAPTLSKHLRVLEDAGLVVREVVGREHHLSLNAARLFDATSWLTRYSRFWMDRFDALGELIGRLDDDERHRQERNSANDHTEG